MSKRGYDLLTQDLARLETIVANWPAEQQATVLALRQTIEDLVAGAFRQLIRKVKTSDEGLSKLKEAVADPWVYGVLDYHGLLRKANQSQTPVETRVEAALSKVRPRLESHQGGVELVGVMSSNEVQIRLLGSCHGCKSNGITVQSLIEKEVKAAAPEIERVTLVQEPAPQPLSRPTLHPRETGTFVDVADWSAVEERGVTAIDLTHASVLIASVEGTAKAYINACPHLGLPLDHGELEGPLLTCRYHGFTFNLASGECLTAPEVQLQPYPVKIQDGRVLLQVTQ